jgi:PAS domain S-box-containing protein
LFERLRALLDALRSPERLSGDREARASAEQARSRLAAIVDSSDDAIIAKDLDGIISDWNSSAERIFGYRSEEVVGRPIHLLLPKERYAEEEQILATLRRGERIEHFETVRVRKDGARIQVSISVSPIRDASGRVVGAAKIARDVTSRKAMEAEREQLLAQEQESRAEAERANRAKDAFLATLSHELRTPLSPIFVWVQLLREANLDEEKTEQALATIERSARSQAQLIDDLLDVSRIVAGKLRLNAQAVELAPVVRAAVDVVRPASEAKHISIQMILDTETGRVVGDADRLQQVVWNLVSNAVKFTPKGGRVQVILERVNSHVEIAVSDTGQGIPSRFLPHVFERFQQGASGPDREHGGLGLGLAIVRHIVELHGGTVFVESPGVDQGSTFTVKLPLLIFERAAGEARRRHPTLAAEAANWSDLVLGGLRVLLVDDEPDANLAVSALLAGRGAEVRVANSAAQALEVLDGWKPDLVVTDIGMPHEDGYALLAQIDARRAEHGRIPVIALTAYAATEDRIRLLAAGFQMHVPKPVEPAELLAAIANVGRALGKL